MSNSGTPPGPALPRMLTLEQVQEALNLGKPLVYGLVKNGELRAAQFGGRGIWRVSEGDPATYIDKAYAKTSERIRDGRLPEDTDQ